MDFELAKELGLAPALVFNELSFWCTRGKREDGWVYKSYKEMMGRLPLSESTIRRSYNVLIAAKLIETKVMKVDEKPTFHYKLTETIESAKLTGTIESAKLTETINTVINNSKSAPKQKEENPPKQKEEELLLLVNKITGRNFRVFGIKSGVKKLLNTFSMVEIESALSALANDDWHKDKIKTFSVDYFIRSTTIDRFLEIHNKNNYRDPRVWGDKNV